MSKFLKGLPDRVGLKAISRRLAQLELGQFGDRRVCRDAVWELRIHAGAGYRIYYTIPEQHIVLLLAAGSKRTQSRDIRRAISFREDYEARQ